MYPGEYPQPLTRVTNVQCTVTSGGSTGYAAARLNREDPLFFSGSGDDTQALVTFQNTGSKNCTIKLRQTDDDSTPGNNSVGTPTGTRFDVTSAIALVPGGIKAVQVSPWMQFLEIWSFNDSASTLRTLIDSRIRWQEMAFDKSETVNDPRLFQVHPVPIGTLPTQVSPGPFQ